MKKSKNLFAGFLFFSLFVMPVLVCSCKNEPDPELTEPIVTLTLSETSPQTEIIISWTPSDEAENYSVERTMSRDSVTDTRYFDWIESEEICSKVDGKFYLTDNTCESGTEYSYVVTASVQRNQFLGRETFTKKSQEKSITTATDPKVTLAWPKNVKVEPSTNQHNALTVTWDTVEGAAGYEVWYTNSFWIHFNEEFKKAGTTSQTSFTQEHLYNKSEYTFMIKAINGDQCSLFSAKASGTVPAADNLTMDKVLVLENGVTEYLYSDSDSLWFKCTPQKCLLLFSDYDYLDEISLSVFLENGTVVDSGLSLSNYATEKNRLNVLISGTTYLLRIVNANLCGFSICVE